MALIGFIAGAVLIWEASPHIPIILATAVAGLLGYRMGRRWSEMETGILEGITIALKAVLILMIVGVLISSWIIGGVVPLLIYYGLDLLSPTFYLPATCVICSVVSLATGSSWTTAATVGVALIGVAKGLEVPLGMAAGAIVSGAYFGDKMSPLSDSTNLAPAVAGSELFEHIRFMLYTTVPALLIALSLYLLLGLSLATQSTSTDNVHLLQTVIQENYRLSPILLLAPLSVVALVWFKFPALPGLIAGALLGSLFAVTVQDASIGSVLTALQEGYVASTGDKAVDELLSQGGIEGMMWTVSLILCALSFGGLMERLGFLRTIAEAILSLARNTWQLVTATIFTCIGMNIIAPDQYLSIVVPGRMYRNAFKERNLPSKLLSRSLEDAGTLSSPLIGWNTCGAYMATALTVSPLAYFPFAFLNLLTPIVAIALAMSGRWTGVARPENSLSTDV